MSGATYFISAGEYSGDVLGADLVLALQQVFPKLKPIGVAGPQMRRMGVTPVVNIEELNVMGVWEVAAKLGDLRLIEQKIIRAAEISNPNFAVLIDYPGMHFRVAEALKARGIEVIQYVAPKLWAWGAGRMDRLRRDFDLVLGILPFEREFFQKAGVKYEYIGSPQRDRADKVLVSRTVLGLPPKRPIITMLPGSRLTEISMILPHLRAIKAAIDSSLRSVLYLVPVPPSLAIKDLVEALGKDFSDIKPHRILSTGPISWECDGFHFIEGMSLELMAVADAAVVASGTATLECALVGTPMVVVYAMNDLSFAIASRAVTVQSVSLVNLIAGRKVVSEHIQNINPRAVADEVVQLITDEHLYGQMKQDFREIREALRPDAANKAAAAIAAFAGATVPGADS